MSNNYYKALIRLDAILNSSRLCRRKQHPKNSFHLHRNFTAGFVFRNEENEESLAYEKLRPLELCKSAFIISFGTIAVFVGSAAALKNIIFTMKHYNPEHVCSDGVAALKNTTYIFQLYGLVWMSNKQSVVYFFIMLIIRTRHTNRNKL